MTDNGREKLRVLMIDSEVTWRGGEGQVLLLMRGLRERSGEPVEVVLAAAPGAAITRRAGDLGVACEPLQIRGSMDVAAISGLAGILKRGDFDIVHCHSSHAHSVAFLAIQALRLSAARRPRLVVSRRVDFPVGQNAWSAVKYRCGVDRYLAISRGVREVLVSGGVRPDRIELVPSGIELAKFDRVRPAEYLFEEFGLKPETFVVGNIAALAPHKSQIDFIHAVSTLGDELPDARFFIVGEGELRPPLEEEVATLGLQDRIVFTGFREDVLEILSIFDCFVLSSYLEGLCTSIMDAHAMSVPVVATDTGGVPDLVEHRRTGLLVPPRDPDKLAAGIVEMFRDEALRESCVRAAKAKSRTYDYSTMVDKTLHAYRGLLSGTPVMAAAN